MSTASHDWSKVLMGERGAIHHVRDGRVMWREVMAFLSPLKQRGDH